MRFRDTLDDKVRETEHTFWCWYFKSLGFSAEWYHSGAWWLFEKLGSPAFKRVIERQNRSTLTYFFKEIWTNYPKWSHYCDQSRILVKAKFTPSCVQTTDFRTLAVSGSHHSKKIKYTFSKIYQKCQVQFLPSFRIWSQNWNGIIDSPSHNVTPVSCPSQIQL